MIEFVQKIALQAGAIALADRRLMSAANVHTKGTFQDMVTDTDRKVEQFIISHLREKFPGHGFFGEEGGKDQAEREFCWIVDPIDGTASFVHDLPNWCISIALHRGKKPLLGVIYAPVTDALYCAEAGQGAYRNGVRLHVSAASSLKESIVITGFSCLRAGWQQENNLKFVNRIAPQVSDLRKYGSAALDLCQVARGTAEAAWELFLQPYDVAAGQLMVTEAGGRITDLYGKEDFPECGSMATNGLIHEEMLSFFSDYCHRQC